MSHRGWFRTAAPDVAIDISAAQVVAARVAWSGPAAGVTTHAIEPLPPGVIVPALSATNIHDTATVGQAVARAVGQLGGRVTRAALVIPDTTAKVSLLRFASVPARATDLVELVRWQMRKTAPFPLDQATVSYTPGARTPDGGQEFFVTVARSEVIEEYEAVCTRAHVHAGLVDIATSSIVNAVLAAPDPPRGDWLLVHATESYTTLAVLRDSSVIFFRTRERDGDDALADVVHQTAMYYEDRLQGAGFSRVLLAGGEEHSVDAVQRSLEQRLEVRVESLPAPTLAAVLGIVSREREVA